MQGLPVQKQCTLEATQEPMVRMWLAIPDLPLEAVQTATPQEITAHCQNLMGRSTQGVLILAATLSLSPLVIGFPMEVRFELAYECQIRVRLPAEKQFRKEAT